MNGQQRWLSYGLAAVVADDARVVAVGDEKISVDLVVIVYAAVHFADIVSTAVDVVVFVDDIADAFVLAVVGVVVVSHMVDSKQYVDQFQPSNKPWRHLVSRHYPVLWYHLKLKWSVKPMIKWITQNITQLHTYWETCQFCSVFPCFHFRWDDAIEHYATFCHSTSLWSMAARRKFKRRALTP